MLDQKQVLADGLDLATSGIHIFRLLFYRFTQGDLIHFLFTVGGTGVGRQQV